MKIAVCINYVDYKDPVKKLRQEVAISVLLKNKPKNVVLFSFNFPEDNVDLPESFYLLKMLKRDSQKDLGNNRRLPYIKDILNLASQSVCDIFGYMNSDILLNKDFFKIFSKKIDTYVFYKKDIEEVTAADFLDGKIKVVNEKPDGVDAVFFSRKWWIDNKRFFPDMILGETEWDTVFNSIIQKISNNYCLSRSLYHVVHERIWTLDTRGAIYNTIIWRDIKEKYGIPPFKPEDKK